jgi:hypothetical protein
MNWHIYLQHIACIGKMRNTYKIMVRKPKGKRPVGRSMNRWEDTIKTDLKGTGCEDVDWPNLAQNRVQWQTLVNTVMYLLIPEKAGNWAS